MANSNNVYATVQPLQGNVADWVGDQEKMDFAYREEQRKVAAIDQARKAAEQKKKDDLKAAYDLKIGDPTGIASFDQAYVQFYDDAMDKNLQLYKKEAAGERLTPQEQALKKNLSLLPEKLAFMSKAYTDNNKNYLEGVKAGNHRDLDYEMTLNGLQKNAKAFLDSEGNPVIGIDKDGDGKVDFLHEDMGVLTIKPRNLKSYDYEKEIKQIADSLGTVRTVRDGNFVKTTNESLPLKTAKAAAANAVYNEDGSLSEFAQSMFYNVNPKDITPEMIKALETRVADSLMKSKKSISETDRDYAGMTAAQREARLSADAKSKSSGGGGGGKGNETYSLNDLAKTANRITQTKNSDGEVISRENDGNVYQGKVDIRRKVGSAEETFRSFAVDKDGNVIVTVDIPVKNGKDNEVSTKDYSSKGNSDVVTFFANRFKDPETGKFIKDIPELRRKLSELENSQPGGAYDDL